MGCLVLGAFENAEEDEARGDGGVEHAEEDESRNHEGEGDFFIHFVAEGAEGWGLFGCQLL